MQQKYLIITIAALAISFGIYIYLFPPQNRTNPDTGDPVQEVVVDTSGSNIICMDCTDQTLGQPIEHFRDVLKNYRTNIWDAVNQSTFNQTTQGLNFNSMENIYPNTDARCIWFSMESIKQFICTIEKNNDSLKQPAQKLGIRFYYAVYGNDYQDTDKRKRHTLFMVPTFSNGDNDEVDFDPRETLARQRNTFEYGSKYDSAKVTFKDLLMEHSHILSLALGEEPATSSNTMKLIRNNAEICPTNCPSVNTLSEIDK